ncbi:IS66 family insertion sequence element accessory protein TnpB [Bradyrhizobium sp. 1050_B9_N1_2]|uniref:IS66 family insertion sequence element accessory protein TnpB n=1 Tax=Bradyrhizobium sp. 1050_B9_N1_2 TaxID=3238688 RepID=UPI003EDC12B9
MLGGMQSLALTVRESLKRDPHAGGLYIFRGRRGDLVKTLWHDGIGLSLYAKRLDRGKFIWPSASAGAVSISAAQMAYSGIWLGRRATRMLDANGYVRSRLKESSTAQHLDAMRRAGLPFGMQRAGKGSLQILLLSESARAFEMMIVSGWRRSSPDRAARPAHEA